MNQKDDESSEDKIEFDFNKSSKELYLNTLTGGFLLMANSIFFLALSIYSFKNLNAYDLKPAGSFLFFTAITLCSFCFSLDLFRLAKNMYKPWGQ